MAYQDNQYITAQDLSFSGILHDIKRSKTALQPIFECFTNSLEAIKIKQRIDAEFKGEIILRVFVIETTIPNVYCFDQLSIIDNGIGFTEEDFKRFNTFKLASKGFKNLGSGRLQYVHYFDNTTIESVFEDSDRFIERKFIVSKKQPFLKENAIVKHVHCKDSMMNQTKTTVIFNGLLEKSGVYNELNERILKEKLLERYIHYFCYNREKLPTIKIEFHIQGILKSECSITQNDIPNLDKTETIEIKYSKKTENGIEKIDKAEEFIIDAFKIPKSLLKENKLNLVSKGEVIEESGVFLEGLAQNDNVEGNKYLFLVSGNFIDDRDTDLRGIINIQNKDSFMKELYTNNEEIFIEDIQEEVNDKISFMYPEIEDVKREHQKNFERLKDMFLLDEETTNSITLSINDSESDILKKFYEAEAKKQASIDAEIKESMDNLDRLDTRSPTYEIELEKEIDKLTKAIPLQNKKNLTHYVARRKLVLDLMAKILNRQLVIQQQRENNDESLIHNLLFQKGSADVENSDLWMINEEFIYFKGSSEKQLNKLEIDGKRVFKDKFTEEEERYLSSLGENRKVKRPDVLLFPEEGKCIIIEFKAPHVNASEHLTQIDKYAGLIRNYTEDTFEITTFYGYLLGESIEARDVRGAVSTFEESYQFDYLFRPSAKVVGFDGRKDGSIYTEVMKYSTLLQRARQRNNIFIDKLK